MIELDTVQGGTIGLLQRLKKSFVHALIVAPVACFIPFQSANGEDDDATQLEEAIVSGSRILRDPTSARETVLELETKNRDRSGLTSLADMLARLSVSRRGYKAQPR